MNSLEIGQRHAAQSDSALVGDNSNPDPCLVQPPDGKGGTIEETQLVGCRYVVAACWADIDRAISIDKGPPEGSMG